MLKRMNILFICDGNVARAQEAELFFNATAGDNHCASSAGTNPKVGKPIDPVVVQVMAELGYGMERAYRKPIDITQAQQADVVVSFKLPQELPDVVCNLETLRYWDVPDPRGQAIEFHRSVRDTIQAKVAELVSELNTK